MAEPSPAEMIDELTDAWRRWTAIVHLFAVRDERRHAIDPTEYQMLHADLTRRCRSMAGADDMLEMLSPWVNLDSLARADRQHVYQLLDRCRQIEQELGGSSPGRSFQHLLRRAIVVAGLVALAGIVLAMLCNTSSLMPAVASESRYWLHTACNTVARNQHQQRLVLGGMVALLTTMAVVWRAAGKS